MGQLVLNICICICMCMGTKNISIMDDVYEMLEKKKHKEESFSEELRRLFKKKTNFLSFAGAWGNLHEQDALEMKKAIQSFRKALNAQSLAKAAEK